MEFLIELLLELILEGSIGMSSNKKISKVIRYPLIFLIVMFFLAVISLLLFLGIMILNKNIYVGLFIISIGIMLLILSIIKFRNTYLKIKNN